MKTVQREPRLAGLLEAKAWAEICSTGMCSVAPKLSRKLPQPLEHASFTVMFVTMPWSSPDGLHVLPADVEDERHLGGVELGRLRMGHGLDHVAVGAQGAGAQLLAIAGGAHGADDELGVGLLKDLARLKQGRGRTTSSGSPSFEA